MGKKRAALPRAPLGARLDLKPHGKKTGSATACPPRGSVGRLKVVFLLSNNKQPKVPGVHLNPMPKKRAALPRAPPWAWLQVVFWNNRNFNLKLSRLSRVESRLSNTAGLDGQTPSQHDSGTRCLSKVLKKKKR